VLLIAPQDQQAWLVGPGHEAARDGVPLCASHADRVTVPFGWQLRDDRPVAKQRPRRKSRSRKAAKPEPLPTDEPTAPIETPSAASRRGDVPRSAAEDDRATSGPAQPVAASASPTEPAATASAAPAAVEPPGTETEPSAAAPTVPEAVPDTAATTAPVDAGPADVADPDDAIDIRGGPHVDLVDAAPGDAAARPDSSKPNRGHTPADVPVHADDVAAAVAGSGARLTVVPGDDDPSKTFAVEPDGQTALWAESQRDDHEPSDETPLLKRAFRVVRED
jgi:hypothetical protein